MSETPPRIDQKSGDQKQGDQKQVRAYHRMVERVRETLHGGEQGALPSLRQAVDVAIDKAVRLGELTREEAERTGEYLLRDLYEAADYLSDTGGELSSWLQFDLELIGERIAEHLPLLVDQTRVELARLSEEAQEVGVWESGEITVGGTFRCNQCGQVMGLRGPVRIDPCRHCGGTIFKRLAGPEPFMPG